MPRHRRNLRRAGPPVARPRKRAPPRNPRSRRALRNRPKRRASGAARRRKNPRLHRILPRSIGLTISLRSSSRKRVVRRKTSYSSRCRKRRRLKSSPRSLRRRTEMFLRSGRSSKIPRAPSRTMAGRTIATGSLYLRTLFIVAADRTHSHGSRTAHRRTNPHLDREQKDRWWFENIYAAISRS